MSFKFQSRLLHEDKAFLLFLVITEGHHLSASEACFWATQPLNAYFVYTKNEQ